MILHHSVSGMERHIPQLHYRTYRKYILLTIALYLLHTPMLYGQTALGQLEQWAGRRASDYSVPAPSAPGGNSNGGTYRLPFQKTTEQKEEEAREHYQKALKELSSRDWDEAVRLLKKAVRKDPGNSTYTRKLMEAESALEKEQQQNKAYQEKLKKQEEERRAAEAEKRRQEQIRQEEERREQEALKAKIETAEKAIRSFKKDIKIAQSKIRSFSKGLANNAAELSKWSNEMDESMNAIIDNAVPFIGSIYIKYCFVDLLNPVYKKALFEKWSKLFENSSPAIQKWLIAESRAANVNFSKVQDYADRFGMGMDLGAHIQDVLQGNKESVKAELETLLFLNSLLETCHITSYDDLIKRLAPFPQKIGTEKIIRMPGDYFELAKIIGTTYTNLAVIGYSWYSVKKTSTNSDEMYNNVQVLAAGIEQRKREIDCLEKCIKNYKDRCLEACTGKTKWSTPPPPLLFENRNW